MTSNREIHLISRPKGIPTSANFALISNELPALAEGEVLVENQMMSVDPYMRGRMDDTDSYIPPFPLGAPMEGDAVGRVVESRHPNFMAGDTVRHFSGWRTHSILNGNKRHDIIGMPELSKIDTRQVPASAYLGILGMPGRTAYAGLVHVANIQAGETVYVSGAAGAVGSAACQIAKLKGCRVIGSAGSDKKVKWLLDEMGIDGAINYKTAGNIEQAIAFHCPDGIDVYFENVGGEQLDAVLKLMNTFGRIALCGLISAYNDMDGTDGPKNFAQILIKSLSVRGFIETEFIDQAPEYEQQMSQWITEGKVHWQETVLEGIDQAPEAMIGLFTGANTGKMLVRLSP